MGHKLFVDGASRGNPGEAAIGAVLYDSQGQEVATLSKCIGKSTNNVAEYQALLEGLQMAKGYCAVLAVYSDSELMVKQILGQYRVKNEKLKPLYDGVVKCLGLFEKFSISHVLREKNKRADELANLALDARQKNISCRLI